MPRASEYGVIRKLRNLLTDERGGATVEFVVLLPAYVLLLGAAVSLTLTIFAVGRVYDVARDVARRGAMGQITDAEVAELAVAMLPSSYEARAVVAPDDIETVRLSITISPQFNVFGTIGVLFPNGITATYIMQREDAPLL